MVLDNEDKKDEVYSDFIDCVNMQPKELEEWLETEESKSVGDNDAGESTGHRPGLSWALGCVSPL